LKWTTQNACGLVQLSWNSYGGHWNAMWARPRLQAATGGHYSTSTLTIDVHTSIILKKIIKEKTTEIQGVSWPHSKIMRWRRMATHWGALFACGYRYQKPLC
jgi:hypothetical protein